MTGQPLRAISSMATRHLLADLAEGAARAGRARVDVESVGGVDAARRVAEGEAFDLVVLADGPLRRLAQDGHVDPTTVHPLVTSQVAAAVPAGPEDPARAEHPASAAFKDADELRAALRSARAIGYSTGPSGKALLALLASMGLSDELADRLVQAQPGVPVATLLAQGTVDLGFQQLSELVGQPGVRILGTMPAEYGLDATFAMAVATATTQRAEARAVLELWASSAAEPAKLNHSFGIPGDTHDR